ncbi:MAG: Nif11-like leader peptide family natural product precursor [Flavobacteriales bacterium]
MAKGKAILFIQKIFKDENFKLKFQAEKCLSFEQIVAFAKNIGYEFTEEELSAAYIDLYSMNHFNLLPHEKEQRF